MRQRPADSTISTRRGRLSHVAKGVTDVVRKHKPDYSILTYTTVLVMIGLIIIFAIGPQRSHVLNQVYGGDFSSTHFIVKQFISVMAAAVAFVVAAVVVPYSLMKRFAFIALYIGLALCALLFLFGNILHVESVARCTLGACRWFNIPGGTIQPAEILKIGLLLSLSTFLGTRIQKGYINDVNKTLLPLAGIVGVSSFIVIVLQKDLGTGISLLSIVIAMVVASNINKKILMYIFSGLLIFGVLAIVSAPHRIERVMTYFQGDDITLGADPDSYHINNAKIAIGSGGFMGVGIGNSVQSAGYLPEAINDSVFAILGETFGFVGLVFILFMFYRLLYRLLNIADALPDHGQRLLVVGVFGWIFAHVIINIGAMTGLIPLTGITLPFLSFGGTSILIIATALGIVFQLSRYTSHQSKGKEPSYESTSSRRRVGRPRYTSSRGSR